MKDLARLLHCIFPMDLKKFCNAKACLGGGQGAGEGIKDVQSVSLHLCGETRLEPYIYLHLLLAYSERRDKC